MVRAAQQDQVPERGRSTVGPVPNVMRVAPAGWAIASGEPAAAISNGDGAAHRRRHDLRPATDVERLRPCIRDHAGYGCVARPSSCGLSVIAPDVLELAPPADSALERVEVERHHDMRTLAISTLEEAPGLLRVAYQAT